MKIQRICISNIPALIWGKESSKLYVHVHGKMSCKEDAAGFAELAEEKGCQTLSFDLPEHGERANADYRCDIWNGMHDLSVIASYAFSSWNHVSLFACSLGAYFSLNTYGNLQFEKCLFQSPILNMDYLIKQMFIWFHITEQKLSDEQEIPTAVDLLRWDYYCYVKNHPIQKWTIPTSILYGGKDNLQSLDVIREFVNTHHCNLTIYQDSEHAFLQDADKKIVRAWLLKNI